MVSNNSGPIQEASTNDLFGKQRIRTPASRLFNRMVASTNKYHASVLITDLDNTLFDWFDVWYRSFSAMLEIVLRKSGIDRDLLLAEIQVVHQRHGTSEYAFLLEDLPSLKEIYGENKVKQEMVEAIEAYRVVRKEALTLFPTVYETLVYVKNMGATVVGYTESFSYYSRYRVVNLGLDGVFDYLFSPPDHALPAGRKADESYRLRDSEHRLTPEGEAKPNPHILTDIVQAVGGRIEDCIYVGDSLHKDMAMASSAEITAAWAKYGVAHHEKEYDLLRRVTHWAPAEVELEKSFGEDDVDVILDQKFGQILDSVRFNGIKS